MLEAFKNHLREQFPPLHKAKLLIAISGGVDSVVLTHLCKESGMRISLAHCNFHLRGEESDGDELFVQEFADALDLEVFTEHFDTEAYAEESKTSVQMAARDLRYQWFGELQRDLKFDYLLTAHHSNDDLETFMINFIRGTGLDGLTGIPESNDGILRPLLPFSRKEIEDYAHKNHLKWREDSSNLSTKYLRNRIRHEIIPGLEELNPQLLQSFKKTQQHLKESALLVEDYISAIFPKIAKKNQDGYSFNIKLLKTIPNTKAILYELFKPFGFTEWNDVLHLLDAQAGKIVYSKTHRLVKDREKLLLTTIPSEEDNFKFEISEEEAVLMLPVGTFHLETVETISEANQNEIFVDKNKLDFPLIVRKWQKGDYFYPFGMEGKKKLSKFFKDNKLSLPQKENSRILSSNDKVVWVIGHRADARFAVDQSTSKILKITYTP
ncbi:tRNA(Ile)-lysidine synthase [Salinimicrobium marinum]|uniref:tRNA(Ile)-lysidine synthase n=1 Tax=Salinimicrobium marinum TaxID=680283 RepID=A0A918VW96_9FLAO|nr:tRNA lysidine(34) synthetase TilS [Salinimicrobium marinum]GHA29363.1 tRNA(Ile)-lysidine synthase [Salinimicrobium marinum]